MKYEIELEGTLTIPVTKRIEIIAETEDEAMESALSYLEETPDEDGWKGTAILGGTTVCNAEVEVSSLEVVRTLK